VSHPPLKIGVIQGHQAVPSGDTDALASIARKLDVDVLISGGTHRFEAFEYEGRFFVNPGSATGAYCGNWSAKDEKPAEGDSEKEGEPDKEKDAEKASAQLPPSLDPPTPTPSFALLDIQGAVIVTYVYQLQDGEVKVEKIEYRKDMGLAIPGQEEAS